MKLLQNLKNNGLKVHKCNKMKPFSIAKYFFYKYNMILPVNNPGAVASAFGSKNIANAMSSLGIYNGTSFVVGGSDQTTYKDSLALALWIVPNSDKLLRVADLIQLEMRTRRRPS